ncbi:MAG: Na+/H+ antiporter, partial [Chthoniobacterales bacterium]
MNEAETIVLLFALVAASVLIARKLALPYPVVLVLVGLALSFIPRLPEVQLNPNIVFYFFLPAL